MSRIGKQPIIIPDKTEVTSSDGHVLVKGPLGELSRNFKKDIEIKVMDDKKEIHVRPRGNSVFAKVLWGTYASHLKNMIQGVNEAFEKKLVIEGVGYRAEVSGEELELKVGFSHPVRISIPKDLEITVKKNAISIRGINKEVVGQFAAHVRSIRKPEPYKGKGIRYENEVVRRKQGKRAV